MPTRHIALVPELGMDPSDLARVAAALQKQVTRDLGPIWQVSATVDAFPSLEDVPAGYWPIILTFRHLGGLEGIHLDRNGQPYALIELSPGWSLTASHICLEIVTDPTGSRTFPGPSPRPEQGDVEFLGGVCDPCEHPDFAYLINDVLVSDFCTPAYWDSSASNRDRRSFTGAVQASHEVLSGGHLSWYDPVENTWWLRQQTDGGVSDVNVGMVDPRRGTVREFIRGKVPHLVSTKMTPEALESRTGVVRQRALRASQSRAYWLRSSLAPAGAGGREEFEDAVRAALGATRTQRIAKNAEGAQNAGRAERAERRPLDPHESIEDSVVALGDEPDGPGDPSAPAEPAVVARVLRDAPPELEPSQTVHAPAVSVTETVSPRTPARGVRVTPPPLPPISAPPLSLARARAQAQVDASRVRTMFLLGAAAATVLVGGATMLFSSPSGQKAPTAANAHASEAPATPAREAPAELAPAATAATLAPPAPAPAPSPLAVNAVAAPRPRPAVVVHVAPPPAAPPAAPVLPAPAPAAPVAKAAAAESIDSLVDDRR